MRKSSSFSSIIEITTNPLIPRKRETSIPSIISDNSSLEHAVSSRIDISFSKFSISKLMSKSDFHKESGIQCAVVLVTTT